MMIPKVKNLCCLRLPHAGLAVGSLTSIVGFLNIVDLIGALIAFDDREPGIHMNSHGSMEIIGFEILGFFLVLLSGILLILGTLKKSHLMLLPWLILFLCGNLIGFICALMFLIFGIIANWNNDFGKLFVLIFLGIMVIPGLGLYIWIGIYSLYRYIRTRKQERLANEAEARNLCPTLHSNCETLIPSKHVEV